jgi:uridine phosphorylase
LIERAAAPILEYDPAREAMIEPSRLYEALDVPQHCVICFFKEVLDKIAAERSARILATHHWEDGKHCLYEIEHRGQRLAFIHPGVGGPLAAGILEDAIAHGCRKFVVCGGCGVLQPDIAVGHLVLVSSAVRDEGVSYHYLPPGREVAANPVALAALKATVKDSGVPFLTGKTWTTDAPYRETAAKVALRRAEGCITVEMEAASFMAVAQFRNVVLGQILYSGDDLSGEEWSERGWVSQPEIRQNLFWLAADACVRL